MDITIKIPLPVLLAAVVAVVAIVFATGANRVGSAASNDAASGGINTAAGMNTAAGGNQPQGWAIASAPDGIYVLNQRSGNLYLLDYPKQTIGNKKPRMKQIADVSDAR